MPKFLYFNSQVYNTTNKVLKAISNDQRGGEILSQPDKYMIAVDRFYLHNIVLPLTKPEKSYVRIENFKVSKLSIIEVNWTTINGFQYDYHQFAKDIETALIGASTDVDMTGVNIPKISFDDTTNKFTITTTSTFRNSCNIEMSYNLYRYLNSFYWIFNPTMEMNENSFFHLVTNQNSITQKTPTLENISPVCKIYIEGVNIPIHGELLPPSIENQNITTLTKGNIITDFKYYQSDNNSSQNILFNADGNHRFASLLSVSNFTSISIRYKWLDYENNAYDIELLPNGSAECKLLLQSKQ